MREDCIEIFWRGFSKFFSDAASGFYFIRVSNIHCLLWRRGRGARAPKMLLGKSMFPSTCPRFTMQNPSRQIGRSLKGAIAGFLLWDLSPSCRTISSLRAGGVVAGDCHRENHVTRVTGRGERCHSRLRIRRADSDSIGQLPSVTRCDTGREAWWSRIAGSWGVLVLRGCADDGLRAVMRMWPGCGPGGASEKQGRGAVLQPCTAGRGYGLQSFQTMRRRAGFPSF